MRIKDKETKADIRARMELIDNQQKKAMPDIFMILVLFVFIISFYAYNSYSNQLAEGGRGNPYNCIACKNNGYACREHRGYDKNEALKTKISSYIDNYSLGYSDESSRYAMYGIGNLYNTDCDFCNDKKEECYSCNYDRTYITNKIEEIGNGEVFKSMLCDECWKSGEAKCVDCKSRLLQLILESIQ